MPHRFMLIGAAGFVAPRHMAAVKAVGGDLVAACDPNDAVGVLDRYFPVCEFFKNDIEMFDAFYEKADYVVICSPNYLHQAQAMRALQAGFDVIVEKPAAISSQGIENMMAVESKTGKRVNCILQMRLHHDAEIMLAHEGNRISNAKVSIDYHTPRGPWYAKSWKSDPDKSGGLVFNIGVHLFDLALTAFGGCNGHKIILDGNRTYGNLSFERAALDFDLSINCRAKSRKFVVDRCEYDFTNGFDDLHVKSYQKILDGSGFGLRETLPAIRLCERLMSAPSA
jgi:UDP-N-acetyl-2-amino-2-deoxyglucuronate dehydrogenase